MESTLCHPDTEKSCFACCPPIRPAGYEHLDYRNMVARTLRENTRAFDPEDLQVHPITGFSCWALGYLAPGAGRVGCLLHPLRNHGRDLRFRVDYGGKCGRETCPEAKVFSLLQPGERGFWLHLADGLDSFSYSSAKANPLFRLLGWGSAPLGLFASSLAERVLRRQTFFEEYPFFATPLLPKAVAYLFKGLLDRERLPLLQDPAFRADFERLHQEVCASMGPRPAADPGDPPVHLLGLDQDFACFLRLSLGVKRAPLREALRLKDLLDRVLNNKRNAFRA